MEWVDGDSLSKILRAAEQRKEKVPPGVALRIIADAAAGLHAAHELKDRDGSPLGVVHRDVSPQNILVGNNGATSVIDFGVAKARDRISQETSAGQLKGKIRYMAPEQAVGQGIDHRADVWALGAMLFELFTGNPPYDGPNEVATLRKLTTEPPPRMPKSFPEPIRAVIDKSLGYRPEERFESALQLNLALEGAMVEIGEPTTAAIVAHYTGQLLQDRKAARKRAVDNALEQARRRDAGAGPPTPNKVLVPINQPSQATIPLPTTPANITPSAPAVAPVPPPSTEPFNPTSTISPSQTGQAQNQYAQHGLAETPSATSATLGLANIEYPEIDAVVAATRRRNRYIGAATLGVFGAAAVVGLILIIATQLMGQPKDGGKTAKPSEPPPSAASLAAAPPENSAETPEPRGTGADVPRPTDSVAETPAPEPTPEPTTSAAPTPAPPPTNPVAAHVDSPRPPPPVHRWQPPPQPAPKPTGKKPVDRGF
jgi:serine/threonine-protein kinase